MTPPPFPSTALTSHQPREASDFSPVTTAIPQTSLKKNLTPTTLSATGAHTTEVEDAFIPTTPMAGSKAETLQASTTASPGDITVTHPEHDNMSLSVNSSTEIPSPTLTASTLEENQPSREATEPFSPTEETDDASSGTPTLPLNTVPGEVLPLLPVHKVLAQGCTTWKRLSTLLVTGEREKGTRLSRASSVQLVYRGVSSASSLQAPLILVLIVLAAF